MRAIYMPQIIVVNVQPDIMYVSYFVSRGINYQFDEIILFSCSSNRLNRSFANLSTTCNWSDFILLLNFGTKVAISNKLQRRLLV